MVSESDARVGKKNKFLPRKKKAKVQLFKKKQKHFLRDQHDVIKSLQEAYDTIDDSNVKQFKDFPLSPETLRGLQENDYITPTEIQRRSIGLALKGRDILGAALTGSGKTLAFLIPMLERLYCKQWTNLDGVGGLIITPVRELALQIFEVLRKVGTYHDFSAGLIIGGKDLKYESSRMDQCNIVICTPGRLLHHMDENPLFNCSNMEILVLDEADRCLDMGFEKTMNGIIENLPATRQTLLFSATQTRSVRDLARLSLKDPAYVSIYENFAYKTPESLEQNYIVCSLEEKVPMLWSFLKNHRNTKIIVFMASCKQVKFMYEIFCRLRPPTTILPLYGTLHQLRRMDIYKSFCSKSRAVLFATDIASRGLDFPAVDWVVQLDCPEDVKAYIHRAGRTARYNKGGQSLLVLLPSEEEGMLAQLEANKIPIDKIQINQNKLINPVRKMEAFLARDKNLKESAQRAFVAYAKSVFLMGNKEVFNVHALNTDAFAKSLGLAVPPRIRFLQRMEKQKQQQLQAKQQQQLLASKLSSTSMEGKDLSDISVNGDQSVSEDELTSEKYKSHKKSPAADLFTATVDSDSDTDMLQVKRANHDLEGFLPPEPELPKSNKKAKTLTKAAVVKKMIKKKIISNRKTVFDEEGKAVLTLGKEKVSQLAKEYEEEDVGGIDIAKAREVLREEDRFDKQLFREKVKKKHRAQRMKKKPTDKGVKDDVEEEDVDTVEGNSDSDSGPDLSWLPDPDKVYGNKDNDKEDSDSGSKFASEEDDEEDDEEEEEEEEKEEEIRRTSAVKRKSPMVTNKTPKKKQKWEINGRDSNMIAGQEELALELLKYR